MATDSHGMGIPLPADSTKIHQFPAVAREGFEKVAEVLAGGMTDAARETIAGQAGQAVAAEIVAADLVPGADPRMQRILNHPEYLWALTDSRRRAVILVRRDGGVELPTYDTSAMLGGAVLRETAGISGFTDGRRMSELTLDSTGSVPEWAAARITARGLAALGSSLDAPGLVAGPGIAAWGDSMTADAPNQWIGFTADALGLPYYGGGVSGQTAPDIAARQGGARARVQITGGTIPASGRVAVTLPGTNFMQAYPSTALRYEGTLAGAGVAGTLDNTDGGIWFTRTTPGPAVTLTDADVWVPADGATRRDWIQVFWAGRNGTENVAANVAAMRSMVAYQSAGVPRFLILQITPGVGYVDPLPLNNAYAREWPENFVRVADWLLSPDAARSVGYTLTAEDRQDVAAGLVPRGFRNDGVHLNRTGRLAVAERIKTELTNRGWV